MIVIVILFILQTREIIRYKIIFFDEYIFVAANRDLFLVRHNDLKINYSGIKSLQYRKSLRLDMINKGMFYFSAIFIKYEGINKEEYILTMWFSKKQIDQIVTQIKVNAEQHNGFLCEVLPQNAGQNGY